MGFTGGVLITQTQGADFRAECPVCDCKITSDRIMGGTINFEELSTATKFKLPDKENMEIEIGDKIFRKEKYDPDTLELNEEILKQKNK